MRQPGFSRADPVPHIPSCVLKGISNISNTAGPTEAYFFCLSLHTPVCMVRSVFLSCARCSVTSLENEESPHGFVGGLAGK